jgi:transposase
MARPKKYPDELVARGVRLALESDRPIAHIAADLGMHPETLRKRVRQAEADSGARPELSSTSEREELKRLHDGYLRSRWVTSSSWPLSPSNFRTSSGERKESYELRRPNEILKSASRTLTQGPSAGRRSSPAGSGPSMSSRSPEPTAARRRIPAISSQAG